ncbi:hypothetical protein ACIRRH_09435 [Kitasatospora sp. NPDC101235]|uniref:hypothetical protein n=1 Tax=Kitasatospora sp. NPDC101235 TaxID=3364101 RepID=UPI003828EEAA
MAGMRITVCLPGAEATRVDEAVAEAMKPFASDGVGALERDVWDGYRITAGGGLPVLAGYEDDPRLLAGRPFDDGTPDQPDPGRCAGGPRELIDFRERQRAEAAEHAGLVWDRWQEVAAGFPAAHAESVFFLRHLAAGGTRASYEDSQEAVDFRLQPAVRAWVEDVAPALERLDLGAHFTFGWDPALIGERSRREYVESYAFSLLFPRNVLTLGGWWWDDDENEEPLHGACHGRAACTHKPDVPGTRHDVLTYLTGLPGNTLLVNVRCHV